MPVFMELTMAQRQAVTKKKALAYQGASRAAKSRILDELVDLTGWHRDYARAALRDALVLKIVRPRPGRAPVYGPELLPALIKCWAVLRAPAGKLLAPMLPVLVPLLRREKELVITDEQAALLMSMSAATIDRKLAGERAKLALRGRSHTKPGTLLKSQIPIRTWAQWDDAVPGFVEIDLVGHEGGNSLGEFCFTLTVTDIATGWTVNRSVRNKAAKWVLEALEHVSAVFPFPILGIDSDNGSEFINDHLFAYCQEHQITFTRSRPGNKNDGAHVEQKNWARVRELVGYLRYDTPAELAKLNEIWELDRLFTNYLLPQQKLVSKERHGAKITKKHDAPATPHQRAIRHAGMHKRPAIQMNAAFKRIKPGALSRVILGGASAGACLAGAAALQALDIGSAPKGVILAYGFFHSSHTASREIQRRVRDHRRLTHSRLLLNAVNRNYAGSRAALNDRYAFPGGHELDGFPPTLIINADRDTMRASGDRFAAELLSAGVDVEQHTLPGTRHAFLNRPRADAFTTAIDVMAEWLLAG